MKLAGVIILFIASLIIQLFFLESWQVAGVTANVVLAFLVVACLFVPLEQILWLGLIGGLMFDFYNNADFGFSMGFYLLIILLAKLIFKFGENEHSWWKPVFFVVTASLVQATLLRFSNVLLGFNWIVILQIILYSLFTGLVAVAWYLVLGQLNDLSEKINFRGFSKSK
jgi:cell shape-determining protein MreD